MEKKKKTYILLGLSVVWAVLIFVFCTMPSNRLPSVRIPHLDKVAHFGFFFVQSVLLSLLFNFQTKRSYFQIICLSTVLAFAYGGLIEIMQGVFFNRSADVYDLIADIVGGFAGAMFYPTVLRIVRPIFKKYK